MLNTSKHHCKAQNGHLSWTSNHTDLNQIYINPHWALVFSEAVEPYVPTGFSVSVKTPTSSFLGKSNSIRILSDGGRRASVQSKTQQRRSSKSKNKLLKKLTSH